MTTTRVDEILDISRVGLQYDRLGQLLKDTSPITLDLSNITNIDCAGIQLLFAFTQTARNHGAKVILDKPSEPLLAAAKTIGLAGFFAAAD